MKKRNFIYPERHEDVCTGDCQDKKPHDLTIRVSICELEIKNLKHQLQYLCKPFIDKQKKSSVINELSMDELLKTGRNPETSGKSLGKKIAGKFRNLIKDK